MLVKAVLLFILAFIGPRKRVKAVKRYALLRHDASVLLVNFQSGTARYAFTTE